MKHQDIIKIAFAESLKETSATPHINIFRYFDQNFRRDSHSRLYRNQV
jgi:hypothetical protein